MISCKKQRCLFLPAMVESGECVVPMADSYYTCAAVRNNTVPFGVADNCQASFCEGDLCNVFATQSNTTCDRHIPEDGKYEFCLERIF